MIFIETLYIKMLGGFSFQYKDTVVSSSDNRTKKVWLLLACLLCRRNFPTSRYELIDLIWNNASNDNPENALKTTLHRARSLLNQLWPSAGHDLILYKNGNYQWNSNFSLNVDIDEFERLIQKEGKDETQWLEDCLKALSLYQGDFLSTLPPETWIIPLSAYYHNLYIQTILDLVPLLFDFRRYEEAVSLCRNALKVEPYHEPLYGLYMQALLDLGDFKQVASVYEEFSELLFSELGIKPGDELKAIYRAATQSVSDRALSIDTVLENLTETGALPGALQCDFDYFKMLCHVEARGMIRTGKSTHISIFNVSEGLKTLSRQSLDTAMERLGEQIRLSLRRGDTFTRCSVSQYIIMIPHANYENSCMVSRKIQHAFHKRYPHCPANISFVVQPLPISQIPVN